MGEKSLVQGLNAMLNFHDTRLFLDVSFFPLQLFLFFDLFFSFLYLYCIGSGSGY